MKLTKAQRTVLDRMNGGDEIWTTSGRNPSAFWHNAIMDRSPGFPTLHALAKTGLVQNYDTALSGRKYRITDLGRSALTQTDGEGKPK